MRSSPFTIVDCSYVLQHHCLWQYRIMLFSKTQSLYKRFDGAVAPKDRNKKMKKRVSKNNEQNPRNPLFTRVSGILFLPVMLR